MFQRKPTHAQKVMIVLMVIALAAIIGWSIPELVGVFTDCVECTYSEWVWDLPLAWVIVISIIQVLIAVAAIGSSWHYLEGWARRRRQERQAASSNSPRSENVDSE